MSLAEAEEAALNNALWCDAVCRAHGRPGEIRRGMWVNRRPTPPFYPNLVTLSPAEAHAQLAAIAELVESGLPGDWGVKDSFAALDLAPLGFRVLFEAQWMRLRASSPRATFEAGLRCTRLRATPELREWEAAWAGKPVARAESIFLPSLLDDPDIAFLAVHRGDRRVAGLVANRGGGVVGISNVHSGDGDAIGAAFLEAVREIYPGLDLVAYEAGASLAAFERLGLQAIGPLRVWVRDQG